MPPSASDPTEPSRFPSCWMKLLFGVLLSWALVGAKACAQDVRRDFSVAWPSVNAILLSGNTLYVGGYFFLIGPSTGGAAPVDLTTGVPESDFPRVAGRVITAAPDGAGGWFLGGQFTAVGGLPRLRLAHVLADDTVSPWNPGADGGVSQLIVSGSTVYVAGLFDHIGGAARHSIAAIGATTGGALPFDPNPQVFGGEYFAAVSTMALRGDTLYVGGGFETIGGVLRSNLAALDATSGACLPWNPGSYPGISTMTLTESDLYVGAGSTIADLDPVSGATKPWSVNISGYATAIVPHGSTVYLAGSFQSLGGKLRSFIGAVDAGTGAVTDWNPGASYQVSALAVIGSTVYAGGGFTILGGQTRWCVGAIDSVTGSATAWDPRMNAEVNVLVPDGPRIFAGGVFTSAGGELRGSLAALDVTTGQLTPFRADIDGYVHALAANGSTLYVGGYFDRVGGVVRSNVAAIDMQTGSVLPWNPNANSSVYSILPDGPTVYLGGYFTSVGGQSRNLLGAVDAISGSPGDWNPDVEMPTGTFPPVPHPPQPGVRKLLKSRSQVFLGGTFTTVGGQRRRDLAAVDATSGAPTAWDPSAGRILSSVYSMALAGNTIYVGGNFDSVGGEARKYLAAVDTAKGLATPWNPDVGSTVFSILPQDSTIYLSGSFLELGGEVRNHIGALNATSAYPTSWDPSADDIAFDLAIGGTTLYAGGEFTSVGGLPQSAIAAISIPDGAVPALISFLSAQVASEQVVLRWYMAGGSGAAARVFRSEESGTWGVIGDVAPDGAGELVYTDATVVPGHRYGYRLETGVEGREIFAGETWVQVPIEPLALYGPRSNPISARDLSVGFSLPDASPARIALINVSGRRVLTREVGSLGSGYHELRLASGPRIGPGVYLLQLSQSGHTLEKRAVILP